VTDDDDSATTAEPDAVDGALGVLSEALVGGADLGDAIEAGTRAVSALLTEDERELPLRYLLGNAHLSRADLTAATDHLLAARELIADDDPERWRVGHDLGVALAWREFTGDRDLAAIAEAAAELRVGATGLPDDDPEWADPRRVNTILGQVCDVFLLLAAGDELDRLRERTDELREAVADGTDDCAALGRGLIRLVDVGRPLLALGERGPDLDMADAVALRESLTSMEGFLRDSLHDVEDRLSSAPLDKEMGQARTLFQFILNAGKEGIEDIPENWITTALTTGTEGVGEEQNEFVHGLLRFLLEFKRSGTVPTLGAVADLFDLVREQTPRPGGLLENLLVNLALTGRRDPESVEEAAREYAMLDWALAALPESDPRHSELVSRRAIRMMVNSLGMVTDDTRAAAAEAVRAASEHPNATNAQIASNEVILALDDLTSALVHNEFDTLVPRLERTQKAVAASSERDRLAPLLTPMLAAAWTLNYFHTGRIESRDAALALADSVGAELADVLDRPMAEDLRAKVASAPWLFDIALRIPRGVDKGTDFTKAMAELASLKERTWPHSATSGVDDLSETFALMQSMTDWFHGGKVDRTKLIARMDAVLDRGWGALPAEVRRAREPVLRALVLGFKASASRDRSVIDEATGQLVPLCDDPTVDDHGRREVFGALGFLLYQRFLMSGRRADLAAAIHRLEQARRINESDLVGAAKVLGLLADCYSTRGDAVLGDIVRAVDVAIDLLRCRATEVLLESSPGRAWEQALSARGEAVTAAWQALRADQHDDAVRALELGRAMVLHSASLERTVPALLAANGHDELAEEWMRESGDENSPWNPAARGSAPLNALTMAMPSTVRDRVLRALDGTTAHEALFTTPTPADVAQALVACRADALVYLLPPVPPRTEGAALVVGVDGSVSVRELAVGGYERLVREFEEARARHERDPDESTAERCRAALAALAEWAWPAVMERLRDIGSAPAKLVLVPVGALAVVPWHAARRRVGPRWRYSCQDTTIAYAASARQFVDASRRGPRAWTESPAVVRVESGRLFWSTHETSAVHNHFYSGGTYLGDPEANGRRSRATARNLAPLLPGPGAGGASMLHLCCHAVALTPPIDSYLDLDNQTRLTVRELLRQARDLPPDSPAALVVLATCVSNAADSSGHDEPLTLASTFLTAGASGVVGTRWQVADRPTALLMTLFHHYLNRGYDDPATALRLAQSYFVERGHRLPATVDPALVDELPLIDPEDIETWAAFSYQGR
jgi:hypothetical protein